jgi:hypothetical protein
MSPRKIILAAAASVLLLGANAYSALLVGDSNAMAGWNGTVNYDVAVAQYTMKADVDYAVYAPGQFNLSFPGSDPSSGAQFVYAYRVHNTGNSTLGTELNPDYFSVGFDPGDLPQNIGFVDLNVGQDPNPAQFIIVGGGPDYTSATWKFQPALAKQSYSEVLIYTSRNGPELENASVQGGLAVTHLLPSPVPEPGLAFAACGMAAALLMRRRVSK